MWLLGCKGASLPPFFKGTSRSSWEIFTELPLQLTNCFDPDLILGEHGALFGARTLDSILVSVPPKRQRSIELKRYVAHTTFLVIEGKFEEDIPDSVQVAEERGAWANLSWMPTKIKLKGGHWAGSQGPRWGLDPNVYRRVGLRTTALMILFSYKYYKLSCVH